MKIKKEIMFQMHIIIFGNKSYIDKKLIKKSNIQ